MSIYQHLIACISLPFPDILAHLEEDSERFGKSTWELFGAERVRLFEQNLAQEKLQLKQAKQDKLKHQQEKIQQEVCNAL